jgi:hypothetical protein
MPIRKVDNSAAINPSAIYFPQTLPDTLNPPFALDNHSTRAC